MIARKVNSTKRLMNPELFKKGKMIPSSRITNLKSERLSHSKARKIIIECEKLTTVFESKLIIKDLNLRKIQLERIAKRISDWEKRTSVYVNAEMQVLGNVNPSNPAYQRIHSIINKFTILHTILQMAESQGALEKGYTQRALNSTLKN